MCAKAELPPTPRYLMKAEHSSMSMQPAFIIDVRSPMEYANGHLKGAVNIPHDRIEQAIDSLEGLEKTSAIMLYCQSGARSAFACQVLAQRGYTRAMNGGAMATLLLNFERA